MQRTEAPQFKLADAEALARDVNTVTTVAPTAIPLRDITRLLRERRHSAPREINPLTRPLRRRRVTRFERADRGLARCCRDVVHA